MIFICLCPTAEAVLHSSSFILVVVDRANQQYLISDSKREDCRPPASVFPTDLAQVLNFCDPTDINKVDDYN
jgi:hypothetical protein